eukprot:scaffold1368_cov333-Pavlova_lutheri.AAC.7
MTGELLAKRVAQVVRRIRGDDQNALPHLRKLHGQAARRGGLADTSLRATPSATAASLLRPPRGLVRAPCRPRRST